MLTIDGKKVVNKKEQTILEVAKENDIYIPTMCTHPGLPNFGACRLCVVKVDGMRGFPTSCTTPATEDMNVTTNDEELQKLRKNIVELLLSEHPNSCIQCDDKDLCTKYRSCPMKSGQITGCQLCPFKESCEFREVIEYLGIEKVGFDFRYKNIEVEREDPFFDRDYNLCILCGRCVRECNEIRGMGVLAFTNRGHDTRVDTAFGKSHLDIGCGFCGACVDVCPTGALSPRATKWHGEPDATTSSICGLCNVNCGIEVLTKWGKAVEVRPDKVGPVNEGQLCALGRFCIPTIVNSPKRLKYPQVRKDDWLIPVEWDEAVKSAMEGLKAHKPEETAFVISPFMTNESAYLLHKFATEVIGTTNIVIPGVDQQLTPNPVSVQDMINSDWILVFSPRAMVDYPLLMVHLNRAKRNGAKVILLQSTKSYVQKLADITMNIEPSSELKALMALAKQAGDDSEVTIDELLKNTGIEKSCLEDIVNILSSGKGTVVYSPRAFEYSHHLFQTGLKLSKSLGGNVKILSLRTHANERGLLNIIGDKTESLHDLVGALERGKIKAIWTTEYFTGLEKAEYVILQDVFENRSISKANVIFPVTAFTETAGTFTSLEGRVQKFEPVTESYAKTQHDCQTVVDCAQVWGAQGFDFEDPDSVRREMDQKLGLPETGIWARSHEIAEIPFDNAWLSEFKSRDVITPPHYRGVDLTKLIEDLKTVWEAGVK